MPADAYRQTLDTRIALLYGFTETLRTKEFCFGRRLCALAIATKLCILYHTSA